MFGIHFLLVLISIGTCKSTNVTGTCEYILFWGDYRCRLSLNSESFVNENDVIRIDGIHKAGYGDNNIIRLDIKVRTLMLVPPTTLCLKFPNLKVIYLNGVQMKTLTENSFSDCLKIGQLGLNNNSLTEITANDFKNNVEVNTLKLGSNQISRINANSFSTLTKLYTLELSNNKLTHLDSNLFRENVKLGTLYLESNFITKFDENLFRSLTKLLELFLHDNKLTKISKFLFNFNVELDNLHLHNNQINEIEDNTFSNLPNLHYLYLNSNKLQKLNAISGLSGLIYFNLSDNQLTKIHPNFLNSLSSQTTTLDLSNNICIDEIITYRKATIDEIRPIFEKCFINYGESCYDDPVYGYTFQLSGITFLSSSEEIEFTLIHLDGKTDRDVNGVVIKSSQLAEIPLAIFTTFINLKFLNIRDTQRSSSQHSSRAINSFGWMPATIESESCLPMPSSTASNWRQFCWTTTTSFESIHATTLCTNSRT